MGRLAEAEGERGDLPRPPHEAVHRSRQPAVALRVEPRFAESADGRVGRRAQLLPVHAPAREAARDRLFRTLDGALVHRREHRRRHREGLDSATRGVLRRHDGARRLPHWQTCPPEPTGSNGFAIAPANSASHHALLWINPHTSFFFRAEAQMTSKRGSNAYGALTWGQFFVYQGFNSTAPGGCTRRRAASTTSTSTSRPSRSAARRWLYRYGRDKRPLDVRKIVVPYRRRPGWRRANSPSTARTTGRSSRARSSSG